MSKLNGKLRVREPSKCEPYFFDSISLAACVFWPFSLSKLLITASSKRTIVIRFHFTQNKTMKTKLLEVTTIPPNGTRPYHDLERTKSPGSSSLFRSEAMWTVPNTHRTNPSEHPAMTKYSDSQLSVSSMAHSDVRDINLISDNDCKSCFFRLLRWLLKRNKYSPR